MRARALTWMPGTGPAAGEEHDLPARHMAGASPGLVMQSPHFVKGLSPAFRRISESLRFSGISPPCAVPQSCTARVLSPT